MGYHDRIAQLNMLIFVSFCSKDFFLTSWLLSLFTYMFFVVCWFSSKSTFSKIKSGIPSEYQTVWTPIKPDVLSGLIWVQLFASYQQTTLVGKELTWIHCEAYVLPCAFGSLYVCPHFNQSAFNILEVCVYRSVCVLHSNQSAFTKPEVCR